MDNRKFIETDDQKTADLLEKQGYQLINQTGNMFIFLNDPRLEGNFDLSKQKVIFSNILCF